ncbi:MAG: hypothetical protein HUJ75_07035, partial [Parasporobacterium sp.]|nr:hypothetical protein [Parasporobacterium sp.]
TMSWKIPNTAENVKYFNFDEGWIKTSSEGVTYFDKSGIVWEEDFEMVEPMVDVQGTYAAVADKKQSDVYLYDKSGLVTKISVGHSIMDVEVSAYGVVAVSTNSGQSNYIEVLDKTGAELVTCKSTFESSGYLMDISLSEDGTHLAGAFLCVSGGSIESRVQFYDFTKVDSAEKIVASESVHDYPGTILTTVEFMNGETVCAVGDNVLAIYNFSETPELTYENTELGFEIQTLLINENYVGFIRRDETGEHNYYFHVYDVAGRETAVAAIDIAYSKALFAGRNIVFYAGNDCRMYSFFGIEKFSFMMDDGLVDMVSATGGREFIVAYPAGTELIKVK